MDLRLLLKNDFNAFVGSLIASPIDVVGVVAKETCFTYDKLRSITDLRLDFDETLYSPKHFLFPPKDVLLSYVPGDNSSYEPLYAENSQVIIGIHPCDLAGIALLDKVFTQDQFDTHYCTRRNKTILIGIYPTKPGKHRFTSSMVKPEEPYLAADAFLIDLGTNSFALELVTDLGKEFFSTCKTSAIEEATRKVVDEKKLAVHESITLPVSRENLPDFLQSKESHPNFKLRGEKCFSCGSCAMVCPTCFCFNVLDEIDTSLDFGLRYRSWDACVLQQFAEYSNNKNPRKDASDRIRHRLYKKQKYLFEKFGLAGCVGCGRCKDACIPDIAFPPDIDKDLATKAVVHV